jgi:hypothetical protein
MESLNSNINDNNNNNNNNKLWSLLTQSIRETNIELFKICLNDKYLSESAALRPRLLNKLIKECITNKENLGCDLLELLMNKLNKDNCYFECWQETCKSVVRMYIINKRQFTKNTIYFILRCYDAYLIKLVFDTELIDDYLNGNCLDWHLMFVASYQERFFAHCFNNILEGFLSRYLLICKLRCSLKHKRTFLTWFSGSLPLYCDEYFINKDEQGKFKLVLSKVFEALILNGILNNQEFNILFDMLSKCNKDIIQSIQSNQSQSQQQQLYDLPLNIESFYPLSLKNCCRLIVKRNLCKYTRKCVDTLPLPTYLKRFILFDNECDLALKCCKLKPSFLMENDQFIMIKDCETQTD